MSNRKVYGIKLTAEERDVLAQLAKAKRDRLKIAAWKVQRTNAMLKCDESEQGPAWTDEKIAEAFGRRRDRWRIGENRPPCRGRSVEWHLVLS